MLRFCCALIDIIFIENELGDVIRFFRDNARKEGVDSYVEQTYAFTYIHTYIHTYIQHITATFLCAQKQNTFKMDNRRT